MSHPFLALALQEVAPDNTSTWIILAVVLVILFFIVVIVGVGLTIFFIMRKRSKAQAGAGATAAIATGSALSASREISSAEAAPDSSLESADTAEFALANEDLSPAAASVAEPETAEADFDPSRTVAISREPTVAISYGNIKFVSGVLSGQEFEIDPNGSYIGREASLAQIVVSDPRISKRHLWIGVRDGVVTIVDQESRNGTFINDPRSERVTEAKLNPGDTVIMGESDVARFEYHA